MDEWLLNMNSWPMTAIDYQDGEYILWGPHRTPDELAATEGFISGCIRWKVGSRNIEISSFPVGEGDPRFFFFFDPPAVPGFRFGRVSQIEDGEVNHYLFSTFDSSNNLRTSTDFVVCAPWYIINPPMSYPLNSLFFYESPSYDLLQIYWKAYRDSEIGNGIPMDYRMFSGLESTSWMDSRSERVDIPHDPLCWFEDTGEWFCELRKDVNGESLTDLVVVNEDWSVSSLEPWNWPGFIWHDAEEYDFRPINMTFTHEGERYFVIGAVSSDIPARYWLIRFDSDSDLAEPVWCRENGSWQRFSHKLMRLGPDQHPYWVFFHTFHTYLVVVDLISGDVVVDMEIEAAPYTAETHAFPVFMPYRTESAMSQPSILILDPGGEDIFKIDLAIMDEL